VNHTETLYPSYPPHPSISTLALHLQDPSLLPEDNWKLAHCKLKEVYPYSNCLLFAISSSSTARDFPLSAAALVAALKSRWSIVALDSADSLQQLFKLG